MSASLSRQVLASKSIPTRRVVINNENELPSDYGTTPGGTIFGTTPGGTRIVYERSYLLKLRQSPLAKTPPASLPSIPGVTCPREEGVDNGNQEDDSKLKTVPESNDEKEEEQFDMEI